MNNACLLFRQSIRFRKKISYLFLTFFILATCHAVAGGQDANFIRDTKWAYTFDTPKEGWQSASFDDSNWKTGKGGFGTEQTPAAQVGTEWNSDDIWIRRSFELDSVPAVPALLIHHDDDAEVFLNGKLVAELSGWTTDYATKPLSAVAKKLLQPGKNTIAIHCHQGAGGQYIDAHVVDAENIPAIPFPQRDDSPFKTSLITTEGEKVTAANAWQEYPRPGLHRNDWTNLNGMWDYALTKETQTDPPTNWDGKILVPFCIESKLSGVQKLVDPNEALWYHRTFTAQPAAGKRTLLNFEAVDYECSVTVNGEPVGGHRGGNDPFTIDITQAIIAGENELIVRVEDDTEGAQLRGKQVLKPQGIFYTQVTGIWQTVWLENVSNSYLADLKISTDAAAGSITIRPLILGDARRVQVEVKNGDKTVAIVAGTTETISVRVPNAKLWSPNQPELYQLTIKLFAASGQVVDVVDSYTGIRTVSKQRDEQGHLRFTLNGEEIFHWGPLDQGWWPDGLLTPPSDAAMKSDIEYLRAAGFNMIRKHIKIEPRRYYYHCDLLGMMVWQDQVSGGKNPPWTRLAPNPTDAEWTDADHQQYMLELERMIGLLENHPCIVVWVPFNEAWGQHRTMEVGKWTVKRDPSRLVNIASGGNFWPVGDIVDEHSYPNPGFPIERKEYNNDFVKVVGEFGGHGFPVPDHLYDPEAKSNWGYGGLPKDKAEFKSRLVESLDVLSKLRDQGISAGVYTQTTDVEGEINGLLTYDRKVIKVPAEELKKLVDERFMRAK